MLALSLRITAAILGFLALVAFGSLTLTTLFLADHHQTARLLSDARHLAVSGPPAQGAEAARRFKALYADAIAPDPSPEQMRTYFERQLADGGPLVLDQVLTDYIVARWGTIDSRTFPPGVYVGARAIGPDRPPLSWVTQYLAQYALYPRHGYVLVVGTAPGEGPPTEFSASRASDFVDDAPDPHSLAIQPEPFEPGAYDFPGRGQAIHELFRLTADPDTIRRTGPELTDLANGLKATDARYELFRQNSNTVLGCMLQASELHRDNFERLRQDRLVSLRLLAIDRPLWGHPRDHRERVRCR